MDEDDHDVYVAQLREVFDTCDVKGDGFLTKNGLIELCQKLQLEDQVEKLLAQLLGDKDDGEVNFEDFKEGFVIVLSDAIDGLTVSSGDEQPQDIEEPPKLVVNEKRYGRRSRPFDSRLSEDGSADEGDVESISGSRPGSPDAKPSLEKQRRVQNGDNEDAKGSKLERRLSRANSQKLRRRESLRKRDSLRRQDSSRKRNLPLASEEEILEASGQISSNTKWSPHHSFNNSAVTSPTEEQQLKTIWDEVNVGANGFLDKHELSVVCEHIGMEGMEEDELSVLFDELDDNGDGQVSFEEFLHGLFIAKDKSQTESDPPSHSAAFVNQIESPRSHSSARNHGEPLTSTMTRTVRTIEANLLQVLDPENIGLAKVEDIRDLWKAQENTEALKLLKHAEVDSEGKVSLSQLTALLESAIYEKSDTVCQAVVSIFKHELTFMRSQVESMNVEKEKLLENASHLVTEKDVLIRESEDHTRHLEHQHQENLKHCEEACTEKWSQEKQLLIEEHEKTVAASSKRIVDLEGRVGRYKTEELRTKQKIGETEDEIGRLDTTLNETQESLEESERVRTRLEKDLGNVTDLSRKLAEVESQRDLLKQQQNQNTTRGIKELEKINRELRDENDELHSQMEALKSQAKNGLKRNRSHRRRTTDRISRVGSVLSDYTKPVIIKRNKDGVTSSEDSEVDIVDGKPPVVRVGGDGGSNHEDGTFQNENKGAAINSEQKKKIEDLEVKLTEHEAKIKELENTVRQQDQNIKAKDGAITKQKTTLDKLRTEAKEKDGDVTEKVQIIERLDSDLKAKEEELHAQKSQMTQLLEAQKKIESSMREKETNMKNLKSEVDSLQRLSSSESSDLKDRFNKELSNLTSQFTMEMEEMQQRFSFEKEEMEQEFQVKYEELEVEYDKKNTATILELKAGFKDEKDLLFAEKSEVEIEFQKQKQMLETFYAGEKEIEKNKHSEELARLGEVIEVLREEKKQLQTLFEKEKVGISEQFAAEMAEIEQARRELCSLERTVEDMEKERKLLENSLCQQNIKNTSLQDEINDLKRRQMNATNRYKKELDSEKEKVNLVKTEMSTTRSKYARELDDVREKLDRALNNNERDQSLRDKILNDAKTEILTLSSKLEEKAKRYRNLEEERSSWEEKIRLLDRQRREMELRIKKTHDSVDEHVTELSKQLQESQTRSLRSDTLVQELYIENAELTKTIEEIEGGQKKAEKSNRQLLEQKRALQRVISKLCGANALA